MKNYNENRIDYLLREYSDNHVNSQECFVTNSPTRKYINENLRDNLLQKEIHEVIWDIPQRKLIYPKILFILRNNKSRDLCGNCSRKKVIAVISLLVLREYNKKLVEEKHKLWKEYGLSWKLYSRIVANVLRNFYNSNVI